MIYLRPATMDDGKTLLGWRNDPETCAASRNTSPIPERRHDLWMSINVKYGYPQRVVLIAETGDNMPIGVVDFAAADPGYMTYEVAITISPKLRGRGYGFAALALACQRMKEKDLIAEIRTENRISRKIFRKCGFILTSEKDGFAKFRRNAV